MTPDEFRTAVETVWPGHGGQERATRHFGWSGSRTIRKYLSGERAVPAWLAAEVRDLVARLPSGVTDVDPRATLAILHEHMMRIGFTAPEAAAGILGAAWGNAVRVMGKDGALALVAGDGQ